MRFLVPTALATATPLPTSTSLPSPAYPGTYSGTPTPNLTPSDLPSGEGVETYIVQPGETLSQIALVYGCTVEEIVAANGLASANAIRAGQMLYIPITATETGPYLKLVPDSELVYGPATIHFDLELIEQRCQLMRKQGRLVGIPYLPVFKPEYQSKIDAVIDKYRNVPKYEKALSEAVKYVRPEPPYYSQELYRQFLGPAVQAVLTSQKADPEKLLHDYNRQFQRRFLDRLNLELGRRKR